MSDNKPKTVKVALIALLLDLSCPLLYFFGLFWLGKISMISLLTFVLALGAPIAAIILGTIYLLDKNKSKLGIALSIIAILLPIIAVITIILLFSTGVLVIRLM
ncbi:MAG: hypothetical protein J6Y44_00225 [Clostridia bacterium]|nr:hypothetical protein [Clostridia bacterium]